MNIIDSICINDDVTLISLCDCPSDITRISEVFAMITEAGIDVDMISQFPPSGVNSGFSFSVSDKDFVAVLSIASVLRSKQPKVKISVSSGNSKITVSGAAMKGTPGVASRVFGALAECCADVRMITTSETEIALLVIKADVHAAVEAIQKAFG